MRRSVRKTMPVVAAVLAGAIALWRWPGGLIDPLQLDYVRAFDDAATRCIVVVAAFDAGSLAVIDSCEHSWQGGELIIELRSKTLLSRDGRTVRSGTFRVPYAGVAAPGTLRMRGSSAGETIEIAPLPAGFTPVVPVIDSVKR